MREGRRVEMGRPNAAEIRADQITHPLNLANPQTSAVFSFES